MPTLKSVSPTLGVNTAAIYDVADAGYSAMPLGTIVLGNNGRRYLYTQASAGIATGDTTPVAVIVTEGGPPPAFTVATGAGSWSHKGIAVTTGQRLWVEANAL